MVSLLKMGFNYGLNSLIIIGTWNLIGILIDPMYANMFLVTYPIQFLFIFISCVIGRGSCVLEKKDNKQGSIDAGINISIIVGLLVSLFFIVFGKYYLFAFGFESIDINLFMWYSYSVFVILYQMILQMLCNKLYFDHRDSLANKYTIVYNILFLCFLFVGIGLMKTNCWLPLIILLCKTIVLLYLYYRIVENKKRIKLDLKSCIKYESANCGNKIVYFFSFFLGISNSAYMGHQYLAAYNFVTFATDTQWDMYSAAPTFIKINMIENKNNVKYNVIQTLKYAIFLILFSLLTAFVLRGGYELDDVIVWKFLLFEFIMMLFYVGICVFRVVFELNKHSKVVFVVEIIASLIGLGFTLTNIDFSIMYSRVVPIIFCLSIYMYYYQKRIKK